MNLKKTILMRPAAITSTAAAFALALGITVGPTLSGTSLGLISTANAAEKSGGHGGEKGGGKKGGESTAAEGTGGAPVGKGGKPEGTGGGQTSGSKLGRLNMARAFMSPGFDITKVDDPAAPIAQIALYKDIITGTYTADALKTAATALGNAATVNPVTVDTVTKLNSILKVTTSWTPAQLEALATEATAVLVARRTEETETTK